MGPLAVFFIAFLTYHCMMLLVYTRRRLESLNNFCKINSYGDLGFTVFGSIGRTAVDTMIVLAHAGFCISYLIFISNTLAYMLNIGHKILGMSPKTVFLWACFPFQLGLNSIPTLTLLAPLSIFADVADLIATAIVMVQDVFVFFKNRPPVKALGGFYVLFYCIGVAVYSFEGIGMVLPLEMEARYKDKFGRVLGHSMLFISIIYVAFGILGYIAFGEDTNDIITTNFGTGWISIFVQIGLCINLFFTFPLMMNPVYEVVERRLGRATFSLWLRWVVVLGVSLVALLVPNFADFLSLVGSSVCCMLGYVLPASMHLVVFKDQLSKKVLVLDGAIVALGFVIAVSGTWTSVLEILASHNKLTASSL